MTDRLEEEVDASTPLTEEEQHQLIPSYIALRHELNEAEQSNILEAEEGFYPDKTDTSEKPDNGRGGVLCQNAESIQTNSNGRLYS